MNHMDLRSQRVVEDEGLLVLVPDQQEKGSWLEWALCSGRMAPAWTSGSELQMERPQCRGCTLMQQKQGWDPVICPE